MTNDVSACYNELNQLLYGCKQSGFFGVACNISYKTQSESEETLMRKLYFKKLFSILGHLALCLIIYCIGFSLLTLVANFFKNHFVRLGIGFGIPLVLVLIRVYRRRLENQEMRRTYLSEANRERLVWREEWQRLCKFPHFLAELLAFASMDLVFTIIVAFIVTGPWWVYLLVAAIYFLAPCILYFIIDFALWIMVHNAWRKDA